MPLSTSPAQRAGGGQSLTLAAKRWDLSGRDPGGSPGVAVPAVLYLDTSAGFVLARRRLPGLEPLTADERMEAAIGSV
jgi:hypothetical protein